jgi:hypothetical protein
MSEVTLWKRRVREWQASGQSALAYARGRGWAAAELRRWGQRLGEPTTEVGTNSSPVMKAVVVAPDDRPASCEPPVCLVVAVAGGCVTVPPGFDARTLAEVLDVLESRGRRR